jgi:hypothetical protein
MRFVLQKIESIHFAFQFVRVYDSFCGGVKLADTSSILVIKFNGRRALLEQGQLKANVLEFLHC